MYYGDMKEDEKYFIDFLAKKNEKNPIFFTTSDTIKSNLNLKKGSLVTIYSSERPIFEYIGNFDPKLISKFLEISKFDFLNLPTTQKITQAITNKIPLLCLFSEKPSNKINEISKQLHTLFGSHLVAFNFSQKFSKEEKMIWEVCQINQGSEGACIIETENDIIHYRMQGDLTVENLENFIEAFLTGNLVSDFFSEKIEKKIENGVHVT